VSNTITNGLEVVETWSVCDTTLIGDDVIDEFVSTDMADKPASTVTVDDDVTPLVTLREVVDSDRLSTNTSSIDDETEPAVCGSLTAETNTPYGTTSELHTLLNKLVYYYHNNNVNLIQHFNIARHSLNTWIQYSTTLSEYMDSI